VADDLWYYVRDKQKFGPVASSGLNRLAISGELQPTDLVWREGMPEWSPAMRVKGLFAETTLTVGPPPVPVSVHAVADAPETNLDERYNGLYRSKGDKMVLGLAGGLAHKFGVPAWVFRLLFFVGMFFFVGWAYFGALFLPQLPTKRVPRPV